jgi:hypothetical protein
MNDQCHAELRFSVPAAEVVSPCRIVSVVPRLQMNIPETVQGRFCNPTPGRYIRSGREAAVFVQSVAPGAQVHAAPQIDGTGSSTVEAI